jgi:hypothetical protein
MEIETSVDMTKHSLYLNTSRQGLRLELIAMQLNVLREAGS